MPQLTIARDPVTLAVAVKAHHQRFRCLVALKVPDVVGGCDKIALYGSEVSCADALKEGVMDFPQYTGYQEFEYLPPQLLAQIATMKQDPIARAMDNLGLIKPDGTPLA